MYIIIIFLAHLKELCMARYILYKQSIDVKTYYSRTTGVLLAITFSCTGGDAAGIVGDNVDNEYVTVR